MQDYLSISLSTLALAVSALTAWLTLLRRGTIRTTRPTQVFLGPDTVDEPDVNSKVYLRTLLYSTSRRGNILESMFVRLRRGETSQTFNVWVYGEDRLRRGSGLFVGHEGVVCNHHFLLPRDGTRVDFLPGRYRLDVFGVVVGRRQPLHLSSVEIELSVSDAEKIKNLTNGVYFDWGPDSGTYLPSVRPRLRPGDTPIPVVLLESSLLADTPLAPTKTERDRPTRERTE